MVINEPHQAVISIVRLAILLASEESFTRTRRGPVAALPATSIVTV